MSDVAQLAAAGQIREAIQLLQQSPTYDASYFYNLGILYGKLNQSGLAHAYLQKANRLNPHDPEILRNLKIARGQLEKQLVETQSEIGVDSASNQFEQFSDRIQGDEILGVIGLVLVVVSLLWI